MKMTLESFEWDVILHLERQLKKLRQKEGKNAVPSFFQQMPLKAYKWPRSRNEFLLGFRHCLLSVKRMRREKWQKSLTNYAYLKVKCFPSAVQWECTVRVSWMLMCSCSSQDPSPSEEYEELFWGKSSWNLNRVTSLSHTLCLGNPDYSW